MSHRRRNRARHTETPACQRTDTCDMCAHGWPLHHPLDGCLVKHCGCWRTTREHHRH